MRFIGNKTNLLENIKAVIDENCTDQNEVFCDIFSGTGSVSRFFKQYYKIISNDLLYFSHILTAATIENNKIPAFDNLKTIGIQDPFAYLETEDVSNVAGFVTEEYSPAGIRRLLIIYVLCPICFYWRKLSRFLHYLHYLTEK